MRSRRSVSVSVGAVQVQVHPIHLPVDNAVMARSQRDLFPTRSQGAASAETSRHGGPTPLPRKHRGREPPPLPRKRRNPAIPTASAETPQPRHPLPLPREHRGREPRPLPRKRRNPAIPTASAETLLPQTPALLGESRCRWKARSRGSACGRATGSRRRHRAWLAQAARSGARWAISCWSTAMMVLRSMCGL